MSKIPKVKNWINSYLLMNDETMQRLRKFQELCTLRFEVGERNYGDSFKKIDVFEEMISELADLVNYAFMQYIKIIQMREKYRQIGNND